MSCVLLPYLPKVKGIKEGEISPEQNHQHPYSKTEILHRLDPRLCKEEHLPT